MPNDVYVKLQTVVENIVSLTTYDSAEEIEKAVKSARYKEDQWIGGIFDAIVSLREIPAADVEPRRYAEWISPDGISVCSNCGKAAPYDVEGDIIMYWPDLNFCPYCGSRMNVEGKNAEVH